MDLAWYGNARLSRRTLLQGGAGVLAAAALETSAAAEEGPQRNLIFILCSGGPAQLDTWDPKPDAPSNVRGPYGALRTPVAGVRISETLPHLAKQAADYALVRSVWSDQPAVHEIGFQQAQTGRAGEAIEFPHYGAVLSALAGARGAAPPFVVLPRPLGPAGMELPMGQHAGALGINFDPMVALTGDDPESPQAWAYREARRGERRLALAGGAGVRLAGLEPAPPSLPSGALNLEEESPAVRERYGRSRFGESCLAARRLVERGTRCVVVNQFPSLFDTWSWDCHGQRGLPTRAADIKEQVAAPFDRAVSALFRDLKERGLYTETLVCCFGEFGRSPELNAQGGRDHWTRCWSVMLGGGGIRGGQVVGASDARGAEPVERPVTPAELAATVYAALGVPASTRLRLSDGTGVRLVEPEVSPIRELLL